MSTDFGLLVPEQYKTFVAVGTISSLMSIFGSSSIVAIIIQNGLYRELFHRIILGLSVADLFFSMSCLVQPYSLPRFSELPFARGNQETCELAGFFTEAVLGSVLYNAFLCIYFWKKVTGRSVSKFFEPAGHSIAIIVPILFGIVGLSTKSYNPSKILFICVGTPYPPDCQNTDTPCERGGPVTEVFAGLSVICVSGCRNCWCRLYMETIPSRPVSEQAEPSDVFCW